MLNQPGNEEDQSLPVDPALRQQIEKECNRIREALARSIFMSLQEDVIERYIQFHQTGIIQLADELQTRLTAPTHDDKGQKKEQKETLHDLIQFFITCLFHLLNYIEHFFSKYFNLDAAIPESYRLIVLQEMAEPIIDILANLEQRVKSKSLLYCLTDYLQSFGVEKFPSAINFRDLIYLKGFISELRPLLQVGEIKDWELKLSTSLIYLNFNHLGFLAYWQEYIHEELDNADSREQYSDILSKWMAYAKGLQTKPGFAYAPAWPNIKVILEGWLREETALVIGPMQKVAGDGLATGAQLHEKIILNLSVAHIACLTRLFYEEGCFATNSVTDIMKSISKNYQSKRQQQISPGSLSKEYYSVTQVTAARVRDLLQRMTARINKSYFPVWVAIGATGFGLSII